MWVHWKPIVWVTLIHVIAYLEGFKVSSKFDAPSQNSSTLLLNDEINDQCDILRELSKQKIHNEGFKSLRISTQRVTSKGGTESLHFKRYFEHNQDNFRRTDSRLIRNASPGINQMTRRITDNLRMVNDKSTKQFSSQREISRDENRIARQFSNLNRDERTTQNRRVSRSVERTESLSRNLKNRIREDERKYRQGENTRFREIGRQMEESKQVINRQFRERNQRSLENNRQERAYVRSKRQVREISNIRDDNLRRSARKENQRTSEQRIGRVMTNDVHRDVNRISETRQNERRQMREEMKNIERRNTGREDVSLRRQEWNREKRQTKDNRQTREASRRIENDRVLNNVRRNDRRLSELSRNRLEVLSKRVEKRFSNNINERQILRTRNQRSESRRYIEQRISSEHRDNELQNTRGAQNIRRRHNGEEILIRKANILSDSQDYRRVISEKREISRQKLSGIRIDSNRINTERYGDNMRDISKMQRRLDKNRNLRIDNERRNYRNDQERRNSPKLHEKINVNRHLTLSDARISKIHDSDSSSQNYRIRENRETLRRLAVQDNSASKRREMRIRTDMENQMVRNIPKLIISNEIRNRRIDNGKEIRINADLRKIRNEYMSMQKSNILKNSDGIFQRAFKGIGDTWKSSLSLIESVLGNSESLLERQSNEVTEHKYKAIFTNSLMFGIFSVQIAGLIKGKNLV